MKKKKIEKKIIKPARVEPAKPELPKMEPVVVTQKPASQIETLRGVRDILPAEAPFWQWIYRVTEAMGRDYNFSWIETPIIEHSSLFVRTVGKQTDIVEKEMYRFTDQGNEDVVLRPEVTASVMRAYINHGMVTLPQPVKLYYAGPMFRYDRPQSGRYRQFHQCGFETIGDAKPVVDAELIMLAHNLVRELGLQTTIQVNSIGSPASREIYKTQLVNYYRPERSRLCEDCKRRLVRNPLRLLDCKQESCVLLRANAPQMVDWIDEDSKNHFMKVLEYLDEAEVPYILNPYLVRGLDYYNRTVFEILAEGEDERSQSALGGGGRYDGLAELIGGKPTPAAGFALGLERIVLAQKSRGIEPPTEAAPSIFVAQLGEQAKRRALAIFEECRRAGLAVTQAFVKDAIKAQMELANKLKVRFTLILGQKEVLDGTIVIRDMESGVQEIVDQKKLIAELKKKLSAAPVAPVDVPAEPMVMNGEPEEGEIIDAKGEGEL